MRLLGAVLLCCLYAGLAWPAVPAEREADFQIAAREAIEATQQKTAWPISIVGR